MKKTFLFISLMCAVIFAACDDSDDTTTYAVPSITAPSTTTVQVSTTDTVTFAVTVEGGYSSSSVSATGGTASIVSEPDASATSGTVAVAFTAGSTAGAGSAVLSVTDKESQVTVSTAVFTITEEEVEETEITVSEDVTEDTTWEAGKEYTLAGRIAVTDGATLTIEAGCIIKGAAGSGTNATALIITQGSKINAVGTAELPIIFTSVADEISYDDLVAGDFASPNLDPAYNGLWGGLIILGYAPISVDGDATTASIEGIPSTDTDGTYGGTDAADNSGVLQYVSIRHGGANIGDGNEINGLSLGGVGSGTTIDHIEIVGNQDDGIEFFGGSVSLSDVVSWNVGDDGLDTDQGWSGTVDNFIIITPSDNAFELDGPEGTATDKTHNFTNGYVICSDDEDYSNEMDGDLINCDNVGYVYVTLTDITYTDLGSQQINSKALNSENCTLSNISFDIEGDALSYLEDATEVPSYILTGDNSTVDTSEFAFSWAYSVYEE